MNYRRRNQMGSSDYQPIVNANQGQGYARSPMEKMYLQEQAQAMDKRVQQAEEALKRREQVILSAENQVMNGMKSAPGQAQALQSQMKQILPPGMAPGNVGDINNVIWPYLFTASAPVLNPNSTGKSIVTITQEAAFVVMSYIKAVFVRKGANPNFYYEFVDPYQAGAAGKVTNLHFTMMDAQSSRTFHNTGLDINQVGNWFDPSKLINPTLFLPNSTIEINWTNSDSNNVYVPFLTLLGYRVRIKDGQQILSTVVG